MASSRHNCVRFKFMKAGPVPPSEIFWWTVLLSVLEFKAEDFFFCLISLARRFVVSFQSAGRLAEL